MERLAVETPALGESVDGNPEGSGLGSNNWAVGPGRSAARSALVANDPHLGLGLPGVWFQAALRAPDSSVSGMTIPGVPGVVLGRSEHLAWAMTNLYVDDVDLFVERLDVTGTKVQRGEEWVPIHVEQATIRLDDGEEVRFEIRSTDRGPLLEPDPVHGLPARSVAWSGYEPADQLLALTNLARARTVAEVPAAVAPYSFPPQNLVVGDRAGHILWTPIGRAPNRFGWDGRFPAPGWKSEVGWAGLLPASENPVLIDPPAETIVTANSFLPVPLPTWFQGEFDTPFRADRIRERLAEKTDWTPAGLAALQGDATSLWAKWLVSRLGGDHAGDAAKAWVALSGWDGAMGERGAPALFALVERHLQRAVFQDEATAAKLARFGTRWRLIRLLEGEMSPAWFDDVATPARGESRGDDRPGARGRLAGGVEALGVGRRPVAVRRDPQPAARPHPGLGAARRPPVQPRAVSARRLGDHGHGVRRTVGRRRARCRLRRVDAPGERSRRPRPRARDPPRRPVGPPLRPALRRPAAALPPPRNPPRPVDRRGDRKSHRLAPPAHASALKPPPGRPPALSTKVAVWTSSSNSLRPRRILDRFVTN